MKLGDTYKVTTKTKGFSEAYKKQQEAKQKNKEMQLEAERKERERIKNFVDSLTPEQYDFLVAMYRLENPLDLIKEITRDIELYASIPDNELNNYRAI